MRRRSRPSRRGATAAIALAAVLCAGTAWARLVVVNPNQAASAVTAGATLETSSEANALLNRAREYIGQDQHREAVLLMQHVMERYGDDLTERADGLYQPATDAVESLIGQMGDEGLAAYRLSVDGEVLSLLGGKASGMNHDPRVLRRVVDRYFMSSYGDDAAYALACVLIDAGRPVEAAHLLHKILQHHPDPSIDRRALRMRLAVAAARGGNTRQAALAVKALRESDTDPALLRRTERVVSAALGDLRRHTIRSQRSWPCAYGNPRRDGVMPGLQVPDRRDWAVPWLMVWRHAAPVNPSVYGEAPQLIARRWQSRPAILDRWRTRHWTPTAQLVSADNRVFYKVGRHVVAVDQTTGRTRWTTFRAPAAASTRAGHFVYVNRRVNRTPWPTTAEEIALFGDRVNAQLALVDDLLLHVEAGAARDLRPVHAALVSSYRFIHPTYNNRLVALDVRDGQVIWRSHIVSEKLDPAAAAEAARAQLPTTRVLAVPLRFGHLLAVPVDDNGDLLLVMLDSETGEERGRHFLCSAPIGSAPRWAPVGLAADGDKLFIATGRGVVFAFDTRRRAIDWASRYERAPRRNPNYRTQTPWMQGDQRWEDNAVFHLGSTLVVAAADSEPLLAFDRVTGRRRHTIPAPNATAFGDLNYVIGVAGGRIYLGGPHNVACYRAASGAFEWAAGVDGATGRGVLTPDAVIVPKGLSVIRIDATTGKRTALVKLSDRVDEPAGNLYSDGRRLYAAGMGRLVALAEPRSELARLTEQVNRGRAEALLTRASALEQIGRDEPARRDLRRALDTLGDEALAQQARGALLDSLLRQAEADRQRTGPLLDEAASLASEPALSARVSLARARHDAASGRVAQAAETYLRLADSDRAIYVSSAGSKDNRAFLVSASARRALSELRRLHRQPVLDTLVAGGDAALDKAREHEDDDARLLALCRVARVYAPAPVSLAAARQAMALADLPHVRRFSQVEATLRELAACGDATTETGAALLLVKAYTERGWPREADVAAAALVARHGDRPIGGDPRRTVAQVVEPLRRNLAGPARRDARRLGDPPLATLWHRAEPRTLLLKPTVGDATGVQALRDNALLIVSANNNQPHIKMRNPVTNDDLWRIQLPRPVDSGRLSIRTAVDRHTLVVRAADGLRAYDLAEGGELWRSGFDDAHVVQAAPRFHGFLSPSSQVYNTPDGMFAAGDGVYVERVWDVGAMCDVLLALDLHTGRPLWRRWLDRNAIAAAAVVDGWVAVLVDGGKAVWLCDRLTGQRLRTVPLDGAQQGGPILWTDHGVLYRRPIGIAFTPFDGRGGHARFGNQALRRMLRVDGERVVVLWSDESMSLLDLRTRKALWQQRREVVGRGVTSVALGPDGDELYIVGRNMTNNQSLTVVDARTGAPRRSLDFGRYATHRIGADVLAHAGPRVPFLERQRTNSRYAALRFYNQADGTRIEDGIDLRVPKTHGYFENVTAPPAIRGGVLLVPMTEGMLAVGPADLAPDPAQLEGLSPAAKSSRAGAASVHIRSGGGTLIIRNGKLFDAHGNEIKLPGGRVPPDAGGRIEIQLDVNGVKTEKVGVKGVKPPEE